ncbi:ABC transporter ATP-binding protein [Shewanella submarina]|uniref:ABC transporter ATP-binding protein n=1 Tax=Shewanella submarina TaxID=2016376 RepID=A0ABV7GM51_9GAMM|nr:ABC transporter ATP-binding protein [Shewanella submarina]MCL1035857.1 ABC transporter ATP-binding protein [Shewanella submarina]
MASAARFYQVSKGFNDGSEYHSVLDGVDLTLEQGDTIALTGPSGSGKSTLLNLMAGFEIADSGEIELGTESTKHWKDNKWSEFRRSQLGVIFQQFNLLTPLNVKDNIAFPLHLIGQDWSPWCQHLIDKLGLSGLEHRSVEQLSGGQQQRVAVARALAHKPMLLLADEPTGNLDQSSGLQVMSLLSELASEAGSTVLMVTHSSECAAFMQRHWQLKQGKILEVSSVQSKEA